MSYNFNGLANFKEPFYFNVEFGGTFGQWFSPIKWINHYVILSGKPFVKVIIGSFHDGICHNFVHIGITEIYQSTAQDPAVMKPNFLVLLRKVGTHNARKQDNDRFGSRRRYSRRIQFT